MRIALPLLSLLLYAGSFVQAQSSITGKWVTMDFNNLPNIIELKADGPKVTGAISRQEANAPNNVLVVNISDGKIDGSTITFKAVNPTGERTITFTGKITGNEISFKRSVEVRPGGAATGAGIYGAQGPMQFTAKRDDRVTIAPNPFLGNWQLNLQKSKFNPGGRPTGFIAFRTPGRW